MDTVQKHIYSNYHTPSSEPYRVYLIRPATLGLGVYAGSNRNENQKQKEMFLGSKARQVREAGW
jgi:hypothetical protein